MWTARDSGYVDDYMRVMVALEEEYCLTLNEQKKWILELQLRFDSNIPESRKKELKRRLEELNK